MAHNEITVLALSSATPFLQQLDAENNKIVDMETLPETVVHVNLAGNQLKLIPDAIYALPNLVALNVSKNSLVASNASAFGKSQSSLA